MKIYVYVCKSICEINIIYVVQCHSTSIFQMKLIISNNFVLRYVFQFNFRNNRQVVITRLHWNLEVICLLVGKCNNLTMLLFISQGYTLLKIITGPPDSHNSHQISQDGSKTYQKHRFQLPMRQQYLAILNIQIKIQHQHCMQLYLFLRVNIYFSKLTEGLKVSTGLRQGSHLSLSPFLLHFPGLD